MSSRLARTVAAALTVAGLAPAPAPAQLVTPKTVPVRQGEQFEIYPSSRAGMGGVSIALDDTLLDPFVNPAKATRARLRTLFTAPFAHGVSDGRGTGMTVPVGAIGSFGDWSIAGIAALQQMRHANTNSVFGISNNPQDRSATNQYIAGSLARRIGHRMSIGGSAYVASLGAVDGVDLLYGGSSRVDQTGRLGDFRLGLTKEWDANRALELLVVHNRFDMTHDVHFADPVWDPGRRVFTTVERFEHNVDRTHIWGAHTEYTQPLGSEGWRVGWLATANRLSHPKIPNYQIMNIPRDPGTTHSFNLGVGVARNYGGTVLGVDVIYEPMFSETWADAASDTSVSGGPLIRAGGRTIENSFDFSNARVRVGMSNDFILNADSSSSFALQLGLGVYAIDYRLRQTNHLRQSSRTQTESWVELTPTLGFRLHSRSLDVSYSFRLTCSTGDCDFGFFSGGDDVTVAAPQPGGIIAAPSAPLRFVGGKATAHQLMFSVPIR